jgi:hypothetical protein
MFMNCASSSEYDPRLWISWGISMFRAPMAHLYLISSGSFIDAVGSRNMLCQCIHCRNVATVFQNCIWLQVLKIWNTYCININNILTINISLLNFIKRPDWSSATRQNSMQINNFGSLNHQIACGRRLPFFSKMEAFVLEDTN